MKVLSKGFSLVLVMVAILWLSDLAAGSAEEPKELLQASCSEVVANSCVKHGQEDQTGQDAFAWQYVNKWVKWTGVVQQVNETLWGIELTVKCAPDSKATDATVSFDSSWKGRVSQFKPDQPFHFAGQIDGCSELGGVLLKNGELVSSSPETGGQARPPQAGQPLAQQDSARPKETALTGVAETAPRAAGNYPPSVSGNRPAPALFDQNILHNVENTVRYYYNCVQNKEIDKAINLYAAEKRPEVRRNVLEAIARDTQYYKIERIEPLSFDTRYARVKVLLYHKKINKPEEYWEVFIEFANQGSEWKILATPGNRLR